MLSPAPFACVSILLIFGSVLLLTLYACLRKGGEADHWAEEWAMKHLDVGDD